MKSSKAAIHAVFHKLPQLRFEIQQTFTSYAGLVGWVLWCLGSVVFGFCGVWVLWCLARPRARSSVLARPPARPGLLLTTGANEPTPPIVLLAARPRSLALRTTLPTGGVPPPAPGTVESSGSSWAARPARRYGDWLVWSLGPEEHLPIHTQMQGCWCFDLPMPE